MVIVTVGIDLAKNALGSEHWFTIKANRYSPSLPGAIYLRAFKQMVD